MDNLFFFSKNTPIILYGAAYLGDLLYKTLREDGYKVVAFIDKRAYELESGFKGLPVWDAASKEISETVKDESLVIVAVKNAFDHEVIAETLTQNGFHNILYRPRKVLSGKGSVEEKNINSFYDDVIGRTIRDNVHINKTYIANQYEYIDHGIKEEHEDYYLAYIPLEIVDTGIIGTAFNDMSIFYSIHLLELYEYFAGKETGDAAKYIQYCYSVFVDDLKMSKAWEENVVTSRQIVYSEMRRAMELDSAFFENSCPFAEWNQRGVFNLKSGKNRASFFTEREYSYMPLRIDKQEYQKYVNKNALDKLIEYIKANNIKKTFAPISHPYFYYFPSQKGLYCHFFIKKAVRYISQWQYKKTGRVYSGTYNVYDSLNDDGAMARFLYKQRYHVYKDCRDSSREGLLRRLDDLLYTELNYLNIDTTTSPEFFDFSFVECNNASNVSEIIKRTRSLVICVVNENAGPEISPKEEKRVESVSKISSFRDSDRSYTILGIELNQEVLL